jgi:hypothetical protein
LAAAGAEPAPVLWIEAVAVQEETASEIEAFPPLPATGAAARSAAPRIAAAAVLLDPAAAEVLPALEAVEAAEVVEEAAAAVGDGGK